MSTPLKKGLAKLAFFSLELIIVLILFAASILGFVVISRSVVTQGTFFLDPLVFELISPFVSEQNTRILHAFSFLGSTYFLLPANILLAVWFLFLKRHSWYSISVPVVSLGSVIMMYSLKQLFERTRPLAPLFEAAEGFSYPSGHSMSAMTFFGLLIFMCWKHVNNVRLKWLYIVLLTSIIATVGFSRIYLRVHYFSDVIAGFSVGLIWLTLSLWIMSRIERFADSTVDRDTNSLR